VAVVEPREFFFRGERSEQPELANTGKPSEEVQRLMEELHKLGELTPQSTPEEHEKRAQILELLANKSEGEMRVAWYRQLADMLSAAVQTGTYPAGIEKLNALWEKLKTEPQDEELAFYVQFRGMTAEHGKALSDPNPDDFAKIQTKWVEDLEKFVEAAKKYPDSAEAMLELAISQEFAGQDEQALKWYGTIVTDFPDSPIHRKAAGAKTRLSAVGRSISLAGKLANNANAGNFDLASLKGKKVVLVQYWATWCPPCKSDMPLLKELRNKYKDFEVIGVNLDSNKQDMEAFLRENDPRWPQLHEDGGLESRYAVEMGIQTLPTMLLIDKQGKVVDRNIRAQGLESEIQKLLK
jgi:thiol-disulfide isomerase/thioredoxin